MIKTYVYPDKNVLHIQFSESVTTSHFDEFHRNLRELLKPLSEEFVLISDFSNLTEMDFACWRPVGYMMDRMSEAGIGQVIRIMPDTRKDIGCGILSTFHYSPKLPVRVFDNLGEVMEQLGLDSRTDLTTDPLPDMEGNMADNRTWHAAI